MNNGENLNSNSLKNELGYKYCINHHQSAIACFGENLLAEMRLAPVIILQYLPIRGTQVPGSPSKSEKKVPSLVFTRAKSRHPSRRKAVHVASRVC